VCIYICIFKKTGLFALLLIATWTQKEFLCVCVNIREHISVCVCTYISEFVKTSLFALHLLAKWTWWIQKGFMCVCVYISAYTCVCVCVCTYLYLWKLYSMHVYIHRNSSICSPCACRLGFVIHYGVAIISRFLQNIGLFCRIYSLL